MQPSGCIFLEVFMRDIVIKKTLTLSTIAILCLIIGIAYGLTTKDRILMIMSGIICVVNIYKIFELHQISKKEKYVVVSGKCLESIYKLVGKYCIFRIQNGDDIIEISVPKNVKLKVNKEYNLYFKKTTLETEGYNDWLKNKILSESFLGYEVISSGMEG